MIIKLKAIIFCGMLISFLHSSASEGNVGGYHRNMTLITMTEKDIHESEYLSPQEIEHLIVTTSKTVDIERVKRLINEVLELRLGLRDLMAKNENLEKSVNAKKDSQEFFALLQEKEKLEQQVKQGIHIMTELQEQNLENIDVRIDRVNKIGFFTVYSFCALFLTCLIYFR